MSLNINTVANLNNRVKEWLLDRLLTKPEKNVLAVHRAGYRNLLSVENTDIVTVSTQVILDERQHEYLATSRGKAKYDVVYGLTRQLADELKKYVRFREWKDADTSEWICRVDLKVVKE